MGKNGCQVISERKYLFQTSYFLESSPWTNEWKIAVSFICSQVQCQQIQHLVYIV